MPFCAHGHNRGGRTHLTGITRGKKLVVLIGQKKALGIAVHNDRPQRRYSGLLASLRNEAECTITAYCARWNT
jgi:hypothetical protein